MRGFFSGIRLLLLGFGSMLALKADEARLLRFPALHGNQVVFTYAGDLYTVPVQGGVARRLTSDPKGFEMFARFSPDGKTLAFTGQYDGNTEVYVMPSEGGEPRRLTYTATLERDDVSDRMGPNNIVMAWKDNDTVVYRSRRNHWNPFKGELTLARLSGGVPQALPVPRGGWCSFSPDGRQMAYNRVFREFRTWKRYRGGQADEIWLHDFGTGQTTRLTNDPAQDIFPMWHGDQMYFVSEREDSHQANLYVMDLKTRKPRRLTEFTEFAVKFPSLGDTGIVFENGGYLYRLDFQTEKAVRIPVEIREDLAIGRGGLRDVSKETTSYEIAPDGARALVGARGDVFTVPAKNGATRNLTQSPGVHERNAVWSPDGKWIAYVSDQSGEDEIWIRPQDGSGEPRALTSGADTYKYDIVWSPDSKRIAWTDKLNRLQFVEVESKQVTLVAQSEAFEIRDFTWSPDSQWLAFTKPEVRRFANIYLYGLAQKNQVPVTDGWFDVGSPEFSSDGKYLFFVSERSFNSSYGQTEWNHTYSDMERIYLVTLAAATKSPLAPKSDEVKPRDDKAAVSGTEAQAASDKDKDGDGAKAAKPSKVVVTVDVEGLTQRITVLPPPASNYGSLSSVGDKLFYLKKGKLHLFDLEKDKETELGEVAGFRVSADRKKMLVKVGSDLAILDLPSAKLDLADRKLSLSDLKVRLDRRAEWNQIYNECWRQMRDFLFDPKLHGVDWAGMRRRYEPLLAHVQHRADLTFIIGEMIGELNIGHAYVGGGDLPKPERISLGLLGAVIQPDASGYFRIERILRGHNWDSKYRSPLTEIGVEIRPGDYILAVQGQSTRGMTDLYSALVGTAGKPVVLRVNREPKEEGARDQTVIPTADEQPLYYLDWVLGNIEKVDKASGGKIGYVHVPDMGVPGLNEFAKFYYPQLHKEALVVDCRGNGGGNVSPMIIERLRREPAMWTVARNGSVNVDPSGQVLGPKVLLIDQHSASDGDIVGYRFRKHRLGPIIGQRSWGGVVGIRGSLPLLDGGILNRPEFSRFDLEAKEWIMEGTGVEPDIEVDNDPTREFSGTDDQLNRAIAELKKAMESKPVKIPQPPAYPDKSK
jgi:tricorn protease